MRMMGGRKVLVLCGLLACLTTSVAGGRGLLQAPSPPYPTCGSTDQNVTLYTSQLAFAPIFTERMPQYQYVVFPCSQLLSGYSRGCTSNSVYNYITQDIGQPPYLEEGQSARPYVGVYAKPADTALEVKQGLYYLDLQTGSIFVSPPADEVASPFSYPHFRQYGLSFNSTNGEPNDGGCIRGSTADPPCPVNGPGYSFYLNEIVTALFNVTSPPMDDPAFACNPAQGAGDSLLGYFYVVLGLSGSSQLPLGPPLATGPIPAGDVPQW